MPISINSLAILQEYMHGVMHRASEHALNVDKVSLTLMGAVIWKNTGSIEVKQYSGRPANILWFWIGPHKYALVYNHTIGEIELRSRTLKGTVISTFRNSTTNAEIVQVFTNIT